MKDSIKVKLQSLVERHEEVSALLSDADIITDQFTQCGCEIKIDSNLSKEQLLFSVPK